MLQKLLKYLSRGVDLGSRPFTYSLSLVAASMPVLSKKDTTLERNKVILVTRKTIRFSKNVYQTCNVTGLSEGEVEIGSIPWLILIVLALAGYFSLEYSFASSGDPSGTFLLGAAIAGAFWNIKKPKHYGLLLTLNSGDKKLFITIDKIGIQKVIKEITDFMEAEESIQSYQISIKNSQVRGNLIQGSVRGDVDYQ